MLCVSSSGRLWVGLLFFYARWHWHSWNERACYINTVKRNKQKKKNSTLKGPGASAGATLFEFSAGKTTLRKINNQNKWEAAERMRKRGRNTQEGWKKQNKTKKTSGWGQKRKSLPHQEEKEKKKKSFRSSVICHGIIRWMISQQFTHQLKVSNVFSNPSSDSNTVSPRNVKPPRS